MTPTILFLLVPFWCSIRVAIAFVGFLGMVAHYSQKISVGIALVCMVNHSAIDQHQYAVAMPLTQADIDCPRANNTEKIVKQMRQSCLFLIEIDHLYLQEGPYRWTKNIQGIVLGGYFWGYLITEIPGGYLAVRYGARFIFGIAMIISGLVTVLIPWAASMHWGVLWFFRFIVGVTHGVIWPSMTVIMAHWAPPSERGKLVGFMNAGRRSVPGGSLVRLSLLSRIGAQIGNVLTLSLGGLMCSWKFAGGWPLIFYSTGLMGFLWGISWILFYADSPRDQRCISNEEKAYILESTQEQLSGHSQSEFEAPWRAILTSPACWALFIIHTCNNWGTYTFLTSIPKYMAEVLRFDIKSVSYPE